MTLTQGKAPMSLARKYKKQKESDIPGRDIAKRYGNQTGRYLLMTDGSRMWVDPENGECLWCVSIK